MDFGFGRQSKRFHAQCILLLNDGDSAIVDNLGHLPTFARILADTQSIAQTHFGGIHSGNRHTRRLALCLIMKHSAEFHAMIDSIGARESVAQLLLHRRDMRGFAHHSRGGSESAATRGGMQHHGEAVLHRGDHFTGREHAFRFGQFAEQQIVRGAEVLIGDRRVPEGLTIDNEHGDGAVDRICSPRGSVLEMDPRIVGRGRRGRRDHRVLGIDDVVGAVGRRHPLRSLLTMQIRVRNILLRRQREIGEN